MDRITLKDYRCFHGEQTARLAPLTLLVGENSTGKTSFMAMLRALWEVAYGSVVPDFKEEPYDLGSFDEIVHNRGGGARADEFRAGFHQKSRRGPFSFEVTFGKRSTFPVTTRRLLANDGVRLETSEGGERVETICRTHGRTWRRQADYIAASDGHLVPLYALFNRFAREGLESGIGEDERNAIANLRRSLLPARDRRAAARRTERFPRSSALRGGTCSRPATAQRSRTSTETCCHERTSAARPGKRNRRICSGKSEERSTRRTRV